MCVCVCVCVLGGICSTFTLFFIHMISDAKSIIIFTPFILWVRCFLFLLFQHIFLVFFLQYSMICLDIIYWYLFCPVISTINLKKFFPTVFANVSSSSFSLSYILIYICYIFLKLVYYFWICCCVFNSFFPLSISVLEVSIDMFFSLLILFFVMCYLARSPLKVFLISGRAFDF